MEEKLTPKYSHDKLENPSFADMVDVFEDWWRSYFFAPIDVLLRTPNGDMAAIAIVCSYFEAIAGYVSGKDTNGNSGKFFVEGFCQVFRSDSKDIKKAAEAIYRHIRCGLAHAAMVHHKVNYSRDGGQAFLLTYRKKPDSTVDIDAGVVSIMVNQQLMCQGVLQNFDGYVRDLRAGKNQRLVDAFMATIGRQWALDTGENIVGVTKAEFLGHTNRDA